MGQLPSNDKRSALSLSGYSSSSYTSELSARLTASRNKGEAKDCRLPHVAGQRAVARLRRSNLRAGVPPLVHHLLAGGGRRVGIHAGQADPLESEGLLVLAVVDASPALVAPRDADRAGPAGICALRPAATDGAVVDDPDVPASGAFLDVDGGVVVAARGPVPEVVEQRLAGSGLLALIRAQQPRQDLKVLVAYSIEAADAQALYPSHGRGLK